MSSNELINEKLCEKVVEILETKKANRKNFLRPQTERNYESISIRDDRYGPSFKNASSQSEWQKSSSRSIKGKTSKGPSRIRKITRDENIID